MEWNGNTVAEGYGYKSWRWREGKERKREEKSNHMKDDRCSEKGLMERREKREGLVTL